jgi:hypothetical protein
MPTSNPKPEQFTLVIRPTSGNWLATVDQRLRRLCKSMLRGYGFKLVSITTQAGSTDAAKAKPETKGGKG